MRLNNRNDKRETLRQITSRGNGAMRYFLAKSIFSGKYFQEKLWPVLFPYQDFLFPHHYEKYFWWKMISKKIMGNIISIPRLVISAPLFLHQWCRNNKSWLGNIISQNYLFYVDWLRPKTKFYVSYYLLVA